MSNEEKRYFTDEGLAALIEKIKTKVDKIDGKDLSTNDFTNAEKEKLAGIAAGAEANVQADWNETNTSSDAYIKNKPTVGSGIGFDNNKIINTGVRTVSTGATDGTIKVNTNGTETEVAVAGLGSAAYTEAADYAKADDLKEVRSIAEGASQAVSYNNYAALVEAFNGLAADKYKIGQNIMIVQLDVPDLWISSIETTSVNYSYTGDEELTSVLKTTGSVQIGYYKLSALETHKIDLTEYLKIADANKKLEEAKKYTDDAVATKSAVQIITWEDGD